MCLSVIGPTSVIPGTGELSNYEHPDLKIAAAHISLQIYFRSQRPSFSSQLPIYDAGSWKTIASCAHDNVDHSPMLVFRARAANRAVLQKPPTPSNPRTNIAWRYNSTNGATKPKSVDVTSNATLPTQKLAPVVPLWQRLGLVSRGIAAYGRSQQRRPYRTQFITSLVIYFLGDISAQSISGDEYDPVRTGRALVISACSSILSYKW